MNRPSRSLQWLVWGSLGLTIAAIVVAFILEQHRPAHTPAGSLPANGPLARQLRAELATRGLKPTELEKEPDKRENPDDLFSHSTLFVLVDQRGQARAVFESDDADLRRKVLGAIGRLLEKQ